MQVTSLQKKAIEHYYQELAVYQDKKVTHETAVRSAFQNLLAAFAQSVNWLLIPEQALANGKRPDGTLRDSFNLPVVIGRLSGSRENAQALTWRWAVWVWRSVFQIGAFSFMLACF